MESDGLLGTAGSLAEVMRGVQRGARRSGTFMVAGGGDRAPRELTYAQVAGRMERLGALFGAWGLGPGDRVLVSSRDDAAVVTLVLSCLAHGLSAVIADREATSAEIAVVLETAQPAAAVVDEVLLSAWPLGAIGERLGIADQARSGGSLFDRLLGRAATAQDSSPSFPAVLEDLDPVELPADLADDGEAYVLFTSGSTARAKGVGISRGALLAHARTLVRHLGYDRETRLMGALPLSHTDGLIHGCLVPWLCRAQCLRPAIFSVERVGELLDAVYTYRATHLLVVPALLAVFEALGDGYEDAFRTDDFRFVISSAEQLQPPVWERFQDRFGVRVVNIYGLTETVVGGLYCGPDDDSFSVGTVGKPVDCEARIVTSDGRDAGVSEAGELLLRGEMLMTGYVADPEGTAAALEGGWLHTGDLATRDGDGAYRIVGRRKNLVISGGRNVQPEEVTEVLHDLPGVSEAVAFGVEDEFAGEVVAACVALEDGCALTVEDLAEMCRERLSPYKVPRVIARVPALPRGASGKVVVEQARRLLTQARADRGIGGGEDLGERVRSVAAGVFNLPEARLTPGSRADSTPGWDSFGHLSLVLALEESFAIRLRTADILALRSLADAERIVAERFDAAVDGERGRG